MGNVSQIVPSIHPFYAIGTSSVNHSKDFVLASGTFNIKWNKTCL